MSTPTPTATATPTDTPTPMPAASPTPTVTATPDPYADWTLDDLSARSYGTGELTVEETLAATEAYTRSLVSYTTAEGLRLYGFMDQPMGPGPHPVVLVLHGYVNPTAYRVQTYTARYADALARAGFLVIHPNYRNHPPSESGDNSFRAGYAIDVLELMGIVRRLAGKEGPLQRVDGTDIALFGHSMGGGIALRVAAVDRELDAAVLYGSTSADDRLNFERWGGPNSPELETSEADLRRISPIYNLERIEAALAVHHGELDRDVPLLWSTDLCRHLEKIGRPAECFFYPGQGHLFDGEADALFLRRAIEFIDRAFAAD